MTNPQIAEIATWRKMWCAWFHGGGRLHRNNKGRLNWRCDKCGRWSDYPVSLKDECKANAVAAEKAAAAYLKEQSSHG